MKKYQASYDTRLLYRQTYTTEEEVSVSSAIHGVAWSLTNEEEKITSRIRVTLLYKMEGNELTPIQGLIEQWKKEGWTPIDEFCDAELVFDTRKAFETHMLSMAKAFLLGVPLNATIVSPDDDEDYPSKNSLEFPKDSVKNMPKKITTFTKTKQKFEDDSTNEEAKIKPKLPPPPPVSDDDDDDEWL